MLFCRQQFRNRNPNHFPIETRLQKQKPAATLFRSFCLVACFSSCIERFKKEKGDFILFKLFFSLILSTFEKY